MAGSNKSAFLDLHQPGRAFILANAWDRASACVLAASGAPALASSSAAYAGVLGKLDGALRLEQVLAHIDDLAQATSLPLSADFENGFADSPEGVAANVRAAAQTAIAGLSIEDYSGQDATPIYADGLAVERVRAAAEVCGQHELVLTARCENYLHGRPELGPTIGRLQAFQEAGAHVLFAPGMVDLAEIRTLVREVDRPVNILLMPGGPSLKALAEAGVARVSVGSGFFNVTMQALSQAAAELVGQGCQDYLQLAREGAAISKPHFGRSSDSTTV